MTVLVDKSRKGLKETSYSLSVSNAVKDTMQIDNRTTQFLGLKLAKRLSFLFNQGKR